ncbi:MAG: hypothetical protein WB608_04740 [Terracidiphilus sp.]
MNRISAIGLLTIASLATCTGAIAQQPTLKANIPFGFTIGDTWMPAGEYTISTPVREVVQVRSADLAKIASIVSIQSFNESKSGSQLVFDKYGDQYFLRHVLCPSMASLNLDVPQGKAEKKARSRALEANLHSGEETMVAAK